MSVAYPVAGFTRFLSVTSGRASQKGNSCGLVDYVYGLDWPHKPATTEAGRKAQQQALLDILDRLQEANFNMVFIQARLRGDVIYRSAIEPATKTFSGKYGVLPGYDRSLLSLMNAISGEWNAMRGS